MIVMLLAAYALGDPVPTRTWDYSIPPAERPAIVNTVIDSVAAKDAAGLSFWSIEEVRPENSRATPIGAEDAIALLSGCAQADVRLLYGDTYTIGYGCPERRAKAKGCDTGDLTVFVTQSRGSLAVGHDRKHSKECPLFVPAVVAPTPGAK